MTNPYKLVMKQDDVLKAIIGIAFIAMATMMCYIAAYECPSCKQQERQIKHLEGVLKKVNNMVVYVNAHPLDSPTQAKGGQ